MENPTPHRKPWFRHQVQTKIEGESMTQQSHRDSVDVNKIIERYDRTGQLPPMASNPVYGDVSAFARPFQEALDMAGITIEQARDFANNWTPPEEQTASETGEEPKPEKPPLKAEEK